MISIQSSFTAHYYSSGKGGVRIVTVIIALTESELREVTPSNENGVGSSVALSRDLLALGIE